MNIGFELQTIDPRNWIMNLHTEAAYKEVEVNWISFSIPFPWWIDTGEIAKELTPVFPQAQLYGQSSGSQRIRMLTITIPEGEITKVREAIQDYLRATGITR